ncbi:MAG: lysozyme family protein [Enterococcus sp.]|nr:lysozyme family protein [Enterococcus sp.]
MRKRRKKRRFLKKSLQFFLLLFLILGSYLFYKNYRIYRQVTQLEQEVRQATQTYGLTAYHDLVLAIIYTETKGQGSDPMQSSESAFGEVGFIQGTQESINQGVAYLAESLALAEEEKVDLATAIQAYNFGLDYIYYIANRGGKNDISLAEEYSRDVLAPFLGNTTQAQYRYIKIPSLIYNGGYLYHNGGNLFYADIVAWNQLKVKFFQFFLQ